MLQKEDFPMTYTEEGLEKLAEIVRNARGNMSERGFAQKIGVSNTTIKRIEDCAVQEPEISTLAKLSVVVGYTKEELIAILEMTPKKPPARIYKTAEDAIPVIEQLPKREKMKLAKYLIDEIGRTKATTQAVEV
jgi:transcriptional regulator with XRE-family HTH domain